MSKLTPYGKALVVVGAILVLCTAAVLYLFNQEDETAFGLVEDYERRLEETSSAMVIYRKGEAEQARLHWAYKDTVKQMKTRLEEQTEALDKLKKQANAAKNMDYRRFTDDELAGILTNRYAAGEN